MLVASIQQDSNNNATVLTLLVANPNGFAHTNTAPQIHIESHAIAKPIEELPV